MSAGALVLDGGLSNQLVSQGQDLTGELWSARLLATDPGQIVMAHEAYLRAGAQVLITSSYQASFDGFAQRGITVERARSLLGDSVRLARLASDRTHVPAWVAASVGPYGAFLADGSEYRGRYGLGVAELERFHRPRIAALAAAEPDVLAMETVPDADEARAMLLAASDFAVPVWLSYTIDGDVTRAGQPLADAFAVAAGNDQVIAVGVNCSAPADVARAIEVAVAVTGKPAVAYPNSGEHWDGVSSQWQGSSHFGPELVSSWREAGAALIGGCCRIGPADIAEIAAVLRPAV